MALPGVRQTKQWFFQAVIPAVRFLTTNKPNQVTYQNLVSSAAFILNSEDAADVAQTQQGLVLKSIAADILAASDTKTVGGLTGLALTVSPKQLPQVALTGGTVIVTQDATNGFLLYTLPAYLLASDGDVNITSPSTGQALIYGSSKWQNLPLYYQTVKGNLTGATQQPFLNFSPTFGVTNDNTHTCTTITIAVGAITYSLIQNTTSGACIIGNFSGVSGSVSEIGLSNEFTYISLSTSIAITTNGIAYAKLQKASTGNVLLGNASGGTANYAEVGIAATMVFSGGNLDIAVNGVTYAKIQKASAGYVLLGNATSSSANFAEITVAGLQLGSGVLASGGYKKVTAATYQVLVSDFNGLVLGFSYPTTGTVAVTMCNPASVTPGVILRLKDISGAAATHNITINPYSGETFDGAATLVISANYGKDSIWTDGTNWFTI